MAATITFGDGIAVIIGGGIGLSVPIGILIAICRWCCGDDILCRFVNWCRGKSSQTESAENGQSTNTDTANNSNCIFCNCCGSTTVENRNKSAAQERNKVSDQLLSTQPTAGAVVTESAPPVSMDTTVDNLRESAPQGDTSAAGAVVTESTPLVSMVTTVDVLRESAPQGDTSAPGAVVTESAPPVSMVTTLDVPRESASQGDTSAAGEVVTESTPLVSMVTTADVSWESAPQGDTSAVTTDPSSAKPDEVDSTSSRIDSSQLQQQITAVTTDPSSATPDEVDSTSSQIDSSQLQQQITVPTVNPQASANWPNSYQLQQLSTEPVTTPPSSMGPSSTSGRVPLHPTNTTSFSAKFLREVGKILNPPSPLDADWRLILEELQLSHGEINNVTLRSNPTEEALRMWEEAGRSLDDLLEVYKGKRLDVRKVIESFKENNEVYSTISAEIVPQIPRHGNARVTSDQLNKLAHNLGPWDELALNLGMSTGDIFKFKAAHKYNEWAQVYYMLDKWKSREHEKATVGLLVKKCSETRTVDKAMYAFLLE